uniref:ANK_REP_REGION domain-containing protein n=1 Tax=Anopheles quadriannulatus TaxID=34691 RepID=A0A182XKP5_ANOQN
MAGSETKHSNDLLCIAEIFESIANKDEQALARTLERSSIETMLLFEFVYGISPLLHCVQTGEMSRLGLVRRLLASGLCDSETVDSKGRTVLAGLVGAQQALTQGTAAGFLERMIEIVIEGADDTTACYRMLKHNSLALFQAFLELKQFDERRLFECLTGALTKLSVKQVLLSADLRVFVMFKLADFGFRRLSGDWTGGCDKTADEWKDHIDVVSDCWNVIGKSYDTGSYGDVDDRLLQRLHVLHNHLYFLQYKKFLDYLALREAIFCVAVFWNVLKNPATFTVYRVIVNKRIVIECIRMIAFQLMKVKRFLEQTEQKLSEVVKEGESLIVQQKECLIEDIMKKMKISFAARIVASESFNLEHLMRGKDRRTRRKMIKCYGQLRQLYSLDKIVLAFAQVARVNPANVESFQDSLKRTVMILGEMLKNTNSTPNMPNDRLEDAMGRMISHRFADIVISIRNSYARQFSLSRLLIDAELERRVYSFLPNHTVAVRMVINLLFVLVMVEVRRSFYGQLVRCGSLEALRSLVIYAGEKDVLFPTIHIAFEQVTGYFAMVKGLLAELRENPIGNTVEFAQLEEQFQVQCGIVEEVQAMLATERELDYENLRKTCFSCNDLPTIRRLLHWKIDTYRPNTVLESICSKWNANTSSLSRIHWMDTRLTWIDTETMSNKLAMITCAIGDADAYYTIGHTSKLIEKLGIADEVDEEGVDQLNKRLAPYYANIFFLDNKWKVLESFCKQRRLPWNTTLVRQLRQRDQDLLQTLYDERRHKLKTIFEQNDIQTVEVLQIANIIIKEDTLACLEHLQLELCEILTAVGYFGDSFHCVKQRIPMIQGKNFRNLLAHDSLSYNMLTDKAHFDLETVQLLVQHGANPLLADCHGNSIIHSALCMLPDAALYLLEECLTRDLRNDKGDTLLELDDRTDGNKLIHTVASCGQQIIVAKLLDLNIDVTVRNAYGCTPAHVAVVVPLVNSISTLKQLLDYDRTPVDMIDKDGGTLLMWAAKTGSIEMLDLIMQYKPNLTLPANRRALYEAVNLQYVDFAKRFLQHAIEAGAREVTKMEDAADDVVILSLRCADFELSKALLEYELQHGLEDITERDRPRIESVLKASTSKIPQVPVELYLSLKGLSEDRNFLTYLRNMLAKLEPLREKDFN